MQNQEDHLADGGEIYQPARHHEHLRALLTESMGKVITPELAANLELAARSIPNPYVERLERLQSDMEQEPQVACPIRHHFAPGIYAREINIRQGTAVVGAVHRTRNMISVSKGRLIVASEQGPHEVCAGETFICEPGQKNAVLAMEDSRWTNYHHNPDDETDLTVLAKRFTLASADELLGGPKNAQLLQAGAASTKLEN